MLGQESDSRRNPLRGSGTCAVLCRSLLVGLPDPTRTTAGFDCLVSRADVPAVDSSDLVVLMQLSRTREAVIATANPLGPPSGKIQKSQLSDIARIPQ